MLLKLALRNMRRSFKDYAIYFVTLVIAVVIFYAFNSITDQHIMQEIEQSTKMDIIDVMNMMMSVFSMIVALVLGFLIIYANQILVRRRKVEFGIYFTLGMKPAQVSRILLYETFMVGLVSLALGLVLGVLLSQLLSFATAALFGISMAEYQFDFSAHAFASTLACFIAIYVLVAVFNVVMIHRCKLIDLINASKKSQKVAVRNPWLCIALFIVAVGILAYAYYRFVNSGFMNVQESSDFIICTVLMLVGTLLLFFSLSGFLIATIARSKNLYYRKLRPFTLRQIASKVNTSFVTMWIVCVLLFLSITTFSTGMNLVELFTGDIDDANPYNVSVLYTGDMHDDSARLSDFQKEQGYENIQQMLEGQVANWDAYVADSSLIDMYRMDGFTYGMLFEKGRIEPDNEEIELSVADVGLEVLPISQLNASLQMIGEAPVDLEDGEYAVLNNMALLDTVASEVVSRGVTIPFEGRELRPLPEVKSIQVNDFTVLCTSMYIALPDDVISTIAKSASPVLQILNIETKPGISEIDLTDSIFDLHVYGIGNVISREEMYSQSMGLKVLLTYLAVYIGLVLLIATAAVLAIQLLSLTIDSLDRYRMLSKLGCSESDLKGSLLAQVLIFFCIPLIPAISHCICAISVINGELSVLIRIGAMRTGIYAAILLVIYAIYMLVTYLASRSMVRELWARS